ncbi:hypothetical protein [Nannocystis radixulma]|uniref:Leucine-rich repeat domain-containing protein n=1 Tax=Nannocystis radixulma TaxID=2995305 RepID=A0ABT5B5F7_9BACT|nr:hypothetical protein [Nannocystis radixulma]MDC0669364.1 hypothetical protein [Nannocystis radixulma]
MKVAQVAKWLAAHPGVDPRVFARRPKQKAAESAAAVRALGTIATPAALDVLVGYRPEVVDGFPKNEGGFGDTWTDPVTKELLLAWSRFDRRVFADRMFSGLGSLWIAHGSDIADISGLDAALGLTHLQIWVRPSCDLSPLEGCTTLSRLKMNLHGRTSGIAPLARIPALDQLEIFNTQTLEQAAVDSLAALTSVRRLSVSVGSEIELGALAWLPKLQRLQLAAGERKADEATLAPLRTLLTRGVDLCFYMHEDWTVDAAKALESEGMTVVERSRRLGLTRDASRAEDLRESLHAFVG